MSRKGFEETSEHVSGRIGHARRERVNAQTAGLDPTPIAPEDEALMDTRTPSRVRSLKRSYGWSVERRLSRHVTVEGDCWIWTGSRSGNGYGMVQVDNVRWMAHRYSYTALVGPVADSLDLDHLCRVRACVNPDHLEPVTRSENLRRGKPRGEYMRAKTHCPKGHPYDEKNTAHRNGRRICRTCDRDRARRNWERARGTH